MKHSMLLILTTLLLAGCYKSASSGGDADNEQFEHPREQYFSSENPEYDNYEGTSGENRCTRDEDCLISGCGDSTCAAEVVEIDDNEFCEERITNPHMASIVPPPLFGLCGCISGECLWYFENDYDRHCNIDDDCDGLGLPPEGVTGKGIWFCRDNKCQFGWPESDIDVDGNADTDTDTDTGADSDTYSDMDSDSDSDSDADSDTDTDGDVDTNANIDTGTDTDSGNDTETETETSEYDKEAEIQKCIESYDYCECIGECSDGFGDDLYCPEDAGEFQTDIFPSEELIEAAVAWYSCAVCGTCQEAIKIKDNGEWKEVSIEEFCEHIAEYNEQCSFCLKTWQTGCC